MYWFSDSGRLKNSTSVVESSRFEIAMDRTDERTRRFKPRGRGILLCIRASENFL